jgi:topoisomerase-4 subunit A
MRISKFDSNKAQDKIEALEGNIEQVKHDLEHLIDFAIAYFAKLKEKYGKGREHKQNFVF